MKKLLLRALCLMLTTMMLSTMFVKGTESYTLVNTVLGSIVQFAVVLAFVLLFQTVYKLFVWILWLIIGKPFDCLPYSGISYPFILNTLPLLVKNNI